MKNNKNKNFKFHCAIGIQILKKLYTLVAQNKRKKIL